ncbi:beta-N-acetylhexosaminidase [Flavobacterium flavipallidum]|uniref:Family 20 glycosylhydrolase n=1 Tax=Flavobacterium flavipallidum TaxID=3139140 RepID=A0ABU9HLW1_9FLAO
MKNRIGIRYSILLLFVVFITHAQNNKKPLQLMPWPQNITVSEGQFLLSKDFEVNCVGAVNSRILKAATQFLRRVDARSGLFFKQGYLTKANESPKAALQINCKRIGKVELYEDESYQLAVTANSINIDANTDLGALHALETLYQLLQNNGSQFYFPTVTINDNPRYVWRGLMIDGSRHFIPLEVLKRNLDGMAAMKLNVFHWHLVDDQGWRIEIKKYPQLTELASDGQFYTQTEIASIVDYATEKGILVVPEIDVPGHASAILSVFPEIGSATTTYAVSRKSGIHDPTLDPTNPKTYEILENIFKEVCPLFPGAYFHIGGDENNGAEWDANPKIQEFKKKNHIESNHDLQTYFNMKLVPMLQKQGKQLMGWEEIMTPNMSKDAIIHAWRGVNEGVEAGGSLIKAAKNGYKTVLSNGFYIDLMLSVDSHYLNDPMPKNAVFTPAEKARILGGEATMWSELVTPLTIDSRIWPRTAAIAERLWSSDTVKDLESMHKRLKAVSYQLETIGLTHIRNKEVILRNIANYQDTKALNDFTNICEPYKIYKRNGGGKKYFMYSPLTLFADACAADASDAYEFNKAVKSFLENKTLENQKTITDYLKKWVNMNQELVQLSNDAPLIQPLLPMAKQLSTIAIELVANLENKKALNKTLIQENLKLLNERNVADVELAIYESLKKLADL